MADFSTDAEISLTVPRRELRSARQEVEDALADIPVGMSVGGGRGGGGVENAAREQRRRRREFRWARQRTDDTEAQLEILENIEGELTEGGLGESAGGVANILGLGGDAAGIATEVGGTIFDALGPGLGSLLGTTIGQQLGGDGGGGGGGGSPVQKPEWIPIQVDDPSPLTVDDTEVSVEDAPPVEFVEPPTVKFEEPPTVGFEEPPIITVDKPEWVPIQVEFMRVVSDDTAREGGDTRREGILETTGGVLDDISAGLINRIPGVNRPELARDISEGGRPINRPAETIGRILDAPGREIVDIFGLDSGSQRTTTTGGGEVSASVATGDVSVTINADIENTVQSAIEELRRQQERQREELRRDLERQINDLERQITGGRRSTGTGVR